MKFMLLIFLTINRFSIAYSENKTLTFCPIKSENFGLSKEFLTQIKNIFNPSMFIETGTYTGNTTALAADIFDQVYSVELGYDLYQKALLRFTREAKKNILLFNNNSPDFLIQILPEITSSVAIFLDAHWSEGGTAKGSCNTPIIEELNIIKKHRRSDCIILIDDIRCFRNPIENMEASHTEYPTIDILISKGQEIYKKLGFVVFGDIAIMYDKEIHQIKVSKVLKALTKYKTISLQEDISQDDIEKLYHNIGSAKNYELAGINWLLNLTKSPSVYLYEDFLIWHAFTLLYNNQIFDAQATIKRLNSLQSCSNLNKKAVKFALR